MIQICSASSEINASIIKGLLESAGMNATIGPGEGSLSQSQGASRGPNFQYVVYVQESCKQDAENILRDRGFIK